MRAGRGISSAVRDLGLANPLWEHADSVGVFLAASGVLMWTPMAVGLGVLGVILLAWHLSSLTRAPMPPSRRRIRVANGYLMLFSVPLLVYGVGFATPSDPRTWVLVWIANTGLVCIVLVLALVDMANTSRLHRARQRELRDAIGALRAAAAARSGARRSGPDAPGPKGS